MLISLVLHIYQPPTQFPDVLKRVVEQSYRGLIDRLLRNPLAKVTLSLPGALIEQLPSGGFENVIRELRYLLDAGRIEITGSAAYHPLLFNLPKAEISRQIGLNERISQKYLGKSFAPKGFFPPELAVDGTVLEVVEERGYEWALLEGSSDIAGRPGGVFRRQGGRLKLVFRNKPLSLGVAFGEIRTVQKLTQRFREQAHANVGTGVLVLAMDGETFGWHQPGQWHFLEELFSEKLSNSLKLVTVSEATKELPDAGDISIGRNSWGARVARAGEVYFPKWEDPENEIHGWQWELTNLAIATVRNSQFCLPDSELVTGGESESGLDDDHQAWLKARSLLDRGLHSDQFFWAEGKHTWHPGMVQRGAALLRDSLLAVPDVSCEVKRKTEDLYDKIIRTGRSTWGSVVKELVVE